MGVDALDDDVRRVAGVVAAVEAVQRAVVGGRAEGGADARFRRGRARTRGARHSRARARESDDEGARDAHRRRDVR